MLFISQLIDYIDHNKNAEIKIIKVISTYYFLKKKYILIDDEKLPRKSVEASRYKTLCNNFDLIQRLSESLYE